MPVPTSRSDLNTTAGNNSPAGGEAVFPNLDNHIRALAAFIAQNYADIQTANTTITTRLPAGVIVMWSGSVATIPTGWVICDGANGTPDLRNRFVVGAGSTYAVAATGGAVSAASDSQGAHTHTGATGSHVLTTAEMPAHTHTYSMGASVGGGNYPDFQAADGNDPTTTQSTSSTGGGGGHTHTISSDGAHTHTTATLPPYYALCYVMKT